MKKSNILFLHSSSDLYGSDRALLNLLSSLDRNRFEPHVLLPEVGPLHLDLRRMGIVPRVIHLGVLRRKLFNPPGLILYLNSLFFGSLRIFLYIKQNRIRLVHTNTTAVLSGAIAAKLSGVPHLWHLREIIVRPRWFSELLSTFAFLFSCRLLAVSGAVRDHFVETSRWRRPGKVDVVYDGINPERFSPSESGNSFREEIGVSHGQMLVGMLGRINRWKGQEYFLDVAEEVLRSHPDAVFLMMGDPYRGEDFLLDRLKSRIKSKGLDGRVILKGFRRDPRAVFSAIDIYVHPSVLPEPFGLVVAEAMAAGKPVVANDLGGVREIVVHGRTGFLVDPKDRRQMVEAIRRLAEEKELREKMGDAGRKRILESFRTEEFNKKMGGLWNFFAGEVG